ncbi:MAG: exodeoxyribonuclease VII large subunit [Phascolarctobacterium sp.]|nr:exodeoxyribonuclease VII large subunit [Phascolarctobacterium sp.]
MSEKIYSVGELNTFIKSILNKEYSLKNVQVLGEISNFKQYPNAAYFSLKDSGSVLKCVMFKRGSFTGKYVPKNGDTVLAVGRIDVFPRDGLYQLYAEMLLPQGEGDLMQAYEHLKEKLTREGLFDVGKKQAIPVNPLRIGIVTSPIGAAVRDIITVSRRRNPGVKLYLYPVKVQGDGASTEIAKAIAFFNKEKIADVLIVGRGGGSIEDLWAFNEEKTVRAIAASRVPIISAVGHETDFTLSDFAADKRAATPSQAAEMATIDLESYKNKVSYLMDRAQGLLLGKLELAEHKLKVLESSWPLKEPMRMVDRAQERVDRAVEDITDIMEARLKKGEHRFSLACAKLDGLSPLAVLARGYSVTEAKGKLVTKVDDVSWGAEIITTVGDGKIVSIVQEIERQDHGNEKNC